jgi:HlyD family secretion protein
MKKSNIFILVLLLIVGGLITYVMLNKKEKSTKVTIEQSTKRDIIQTVTANGKIYPELEVKISSDVSGEIVELFFKEGDLIKRGDLIARIQPDSYNNAVAQVNASYKNSLANIENSKARLLQAEAALSNAKSYFKRIEAAYQDKVISSTEFDNAKDQVVRAEAEVTAAKKMVEASQYSAEAIQASINDAKTNLGRTAIYAPIDGIISAMGVEKGEKVVGTLQMTGTEMMRIADFKNMEVRVNVSENDIVRVHLGDSAIVEVDAYPDHKFKGIVTSIASSSLGLNNALSSATSQSTNFEVKILILAESYQDLIEDNPLPFRPGMSATADIQTKRKNDVLAIPIQAVGIRNLNEDSTSLSENIVEIVFVENEGTVVQKIVKTGIQNDSYIEVLEGIEVGKNVVTAPYNAISKELEDGQKVEVVSKKDLYKISEKESKP